MSSEARKEKKKNSKEKQKKRNEETKRCRFFKVEERSIRSVRPRGTTTSSSRDRHTVICMHRPHPDSNPLRISTPVESRSLFDAQAVAPATAAQAAAPCPSPSPSDSDPPSDSPAPAPSQTTQAEAALSRAASLPRAPHIPRAGAAWSDSGSARCCDPSQHSHHCH